MRFRERVRFGREVFDYANQLRQRGLTIDDFPQVFPDAYQRLGPRLEDLTVRDILVAQIGGLIELGPIKCYRTSRYFLRLRKSGESPKVSE